MWPDLTTPGFQINISITYLIIYVIHCTYLEALQCVRASFCHKFHSLSMDQPFIVQLVYFPAILDSFLQHHNCLYKRVINGETGTHLRTRGKGLQSHQTLECNPSLQLEMFSLASSAFQVNSISQIN